MSGPNLVFAMTCVRKVFCFAKSVMDNSTTGRGSPFPSSHVGPFLTSDDGTGGNVRFSGRSPSVVLSPTSGISKLPGS